MAILCCVGSAAARAGRHAAAKQTIMRIQHALGMKSLIF